MKAIGRASAHHLGLTKDTLRGAIKLRLEELDRTMISLAPHCGIKPNTLRQRLSKTRGKRALSPWQCSQIAKELGMDEHVLHRLAAKQEGWRIEADSESAKEHA